MLSVERYAGNSSENPTAAEVRGILDIVFFDLRGAVDRYVETESSSSEKYVGNMVSSEEHPTVQFGMLGLREATIHQLSPPATGKLGGCPEMRSPHLFSFDILSTQYCGRNF